jgi:hypothetical protein
VVQAAILQNMPMFAIMEDDLMPVGDVREVRTTSFSLRTVEAGVKPTAGRLPVKSATKVSKTTVPC